MMETKISKEDKLYNQIENICIFLNRKKELGYFIIDKDNDIMKGKFVFSTPFSQKCIAINEEGSRCWSTILDYGKQNTHGMSTLLSEYKQALKYIQSLRYLHLRDIMKVKDLLQFEKLI